MFLVASVPLATQSSRSNNTPRANMQWFWRRGMLVKGMYQCCRDQRRRRLYEDIISLLLYIIGAIAVLMVVIGGIRYVVSGGDQRP